MDKTPWGSTQNFCGAVLKAKRPNPISGQNSQNIIVEMLSVFCLLFGNDFR